MSLLANDCKVHDRKIIVLIFSILSSFISIAAQGRMVWTSQNSPTAESLNGIGEPEMSISPSPNVVGDKGIILSSGIIFGTWNIPNSWVSKNLNAITDIYNYPQRTVVAVGDSGTILTSPNCTTWTARTSGTASTLRGIAHKWWASPDLIVAVGDHGTILTSSDGSSWTFQASGTQANLQAVTYNPNNQIGYFIAVGDSGTILTSLSGINWSHQSSPSKRCLKGVTYSGNGNIIAGDSGTILTSPDTTDWTIQTSGTSNDLNAVYCLFDLRTGKIMADTGASYFYRGQYNVAIGNHGTIISSQEGKSWATQSSGTQQNLYGISGRGNTFIVVGDHGTILTSSIRYVGVLAPINCDKRRYFEIHGSIVFYFLSASLKASLQLYSLSGRLVKTLFSRELGNGMHTATIPSSLVPGSYIISLRASTTKVDRVIVISGQK